MAAAATHGVIRTGHAVRALVAAETSSRLAELANGLAYWAASYQSLPIRRDTGRTGEAPGRAIMRVATLPIERRTFNDTITGSFEPLADFPDFAGAIDLADLRGDPARVIAQLTATFARVYLANAHDPLTTIVFIHSVTSATAVRSLLAGLGPRAAEISVRYLWQVQCALYAVFGSRPVPSHPIAAPSESREELIAMAVRHGDEHVIKFTEACLREDAIAPVPEYRAAARHAITMLAR